MYDVLIKIPHNKFLGNYGTVQGLVVYVMLYTICTKTFTQLGQYLKLLMRFGLNVYLLHELEAHLSLVMSKTADDFTTRRRSNASRSSSSVKISFSVPSFQPKSAR